MIDTTGQQVETRLQRLEAQMKVLTTRLNQTAEAEIEYVIFVDNQEVWAGPDVDRQLPKVFKQYPNKQIRVDWRSIPFNWA
ncbi:MAG: hypothetical protein HND44_13955 [Chloroflexi bacterium]|nr:hypothetical protein [Ardenticatenaceae bacterium]MBL1129580.1 hypothetical protein [Chloroflexota bacterium]NOG35661.1 hypothetical protein [Chloroflexota bacterium]GIK56990.1 MAG: hypothetical protein BroJett015_26530 [Chloroflexota bacterium]